MAGICHDCRKRALVDVSNAPLARPLKARAPEDPVPLSERAKSIAMSVSAGSVPAKPDAAQTTPAAKTQDADAESSTYSDSSTIATPDDTSTEACSSPTSPTTPSRSEQQSAHLLMKACEREEAAEERAELAEQALQESNRKLAAAEVALQAAQDRIKLLEVQVRNHVMKMPEVQGSQCDQASLSDDSNMSATSEMRTSEDWQQRGSFDWDSAQVDSETVQLRLELEAANARLTLSREAEQKAVVFAEAASTRMDAFAKMLRGAADVAFVGCDASARRLRHHLFRCLDVDCDGFLGGGDLQHWYRVSERFLDTQGHDPVSFEALQAQLADALYNPSLPPEFACRGKVSLLQLSKTKMGGGIIATLLNLDNLMQVRNSSEWGGFRSVPIS